jgi:hypothetical protein
MVTHHAGGPETFISGMSTQEQSHYQKRISAKRRNPIPTKLVYTPSKHCEPEQCCRDSAEDEKSFNVSVLGYSCMIMMRSDATEFGFTSPHYVPTRCPPIPYMPTRHCLLVSRTTHVHSLNHQPRCYSFERLPTSPTSNIPEQRTMPKPALYSDPQKSSGATIRNGCRIAASTY